MRLGFYRALYKRIIGRRRGRGREDELLRVPLESTSRPVFVLFAHAAVKW